MGRSQDSFNKKEVRNKKEKKRKEKAQKRLARREQDKSNFDDMIAYVDENGVISDTPPDPDNKYEVDAEQIEVSIPKTDPSLKNDPIHKGVVTFFNHSKGYGFIRDLDNRQSVFVHANNLVDQINENNLVTFEVERGPKGFNAVNVRISK